VPVIAAVPERGAEIGGGPVTLAVVVVTVVVADVAEVVRLHRL
jgi:hypothetical protein